MLFFIVVLLVFIGGMVLLVDDLVLVDLGIGEVWCWDGGYL